jgi:hypothetical protein
MFIDLSRYRILLAPAERKVVELRALLSETSRSAGALLVSKGRVSINIRLLRSCFSSWLRLSRVVKSTDPPTPDFEPGRRRPSTLRLRLPWRGGQIIQLNHRPFSYQWSRGMECRSSQRL